MTPRHADPPPNPADPVAQRLTSRTVPAALSDTPLFRATVLALGYHPAGYHRDDGGRWVAPDGRRGMLHFGPVPR